jgi:hypothetical protein
MYSESSSEISSCNTPENKLSGLKFLNSGVWKLYELSVIKFYPLKGYNWDVYCFAQLCFFYFGGGKIIW